LVVRALASAALALLGLVSSAARAQAPQPEEFLMIVNAHNPVSVAKREFLADAFLKKVTRWDDDEAVRPVDLRPASAARQVFSGAVLRRKVAAVRSYWQQCIFSGREVPPPELDSDEAVTRYVAKYRGAVGYVSPAAKLGDGVKVVLVRP